MFFSRNILSINWQELPQYLTLNALPTIIIKLLSTVILLCIIPVVYSNYILSFMYRMPIETHLMQRTIQDMCEIGPLKEESIVKVDSEV